MEFKLNKISAAITGALAVGFAGHAAALTPDQYNSTAGDTLDVFLSGASAQDNGIKSLMRRLCEPGSLDAYTDTNQALFLCTVNTAQVAGLGKSKIAVRKSSVGGSGNGVQPVADATQLTFLDPDALKTAYLLAGSPGTNPFGSCAAASAVNLVSPSSASVDTIGLPAYSTRSCAATGYVVNSSVSTTATVMTALGTPDAGFSDVEPALFGATSTQQANLTAKSVNNVIFGIVATKSLRDALQAAQGLSVGDETEQYMPSLTTTQISSLLNGQIKAWSKFQFSNGTNPPTALANANTNAGASQAFRDIAWIVRRVNTSGTQVFAQVHFLNDGCTAGVVPFVTATDTALNNAGSTCGALGTTAANTKRVYQGSGGGDVKNCMVHHDSLGKWAIGILTTEELTPTATSSTWRFLKIDGYSPAQINVFNGKYKYWSEQSMQYRSTTNPLGGDQLTFVNTMATRLADPFVIDDLNNALVHPFGKAGLMALAVGPVAPLNATTTIITPAALAALPVNTHTRNPTGNLNNCQPALPLFPIAW